MGFIVPKMVKWEICIDRTSTICYTMLMKQIRWNEEKNQLLLMQRGVGFDMVVDLLERGEFLAKKEHPNKQKYPNQFIFVVRLNGYVYYIPFVENEEEIFLKTIIPSRKLDEAYKESK